MFIDDIIVFSKDEVEFLTNLQSVFERCRRIRNVLNPKKCKLDLYRVEYVGRIIDGIGLSFSTEKKEQIINLGLPIRKKYLKSFIIEFNRNRVQSHFVLVKPVQDVFTPSQLHKILK